MFGYGRRAPARGRSQALQCLWTLPLCWLAGLLLLWLAFLIPGDAAFRHAEDSLGLLQNEGLHYNLGHEYDHYKQDTKLDGFTDLLMINFSTNVAQERETTPLARAVSPAWVAAESAENEYDSAQLLSFLERPDENVESHYFRRYWLGYILPLRLLFTFLRLDQIRVLAGVVQCLLTLLCCLVVGKKTNWLCALTILAAYYALQPVALSQSLSFTPPFYVAMAGCLAAACTAGKRPPMVAPMRLFMLLGASVVYLDSLTYPLITLGLPLTVALTAQGDALGKAPLKRSLLYLFQVGAAWAFGYLGMWAGKWLVTWLAGYTDIFQEAMAAAEERTSVGGYSLTLTLLGLETYCFTRRKLALLLLPAVLGLGLSAVQLRRTRLFGEAGKRALLFGSVALLPVAWTAVLLNHTSLHWFFTHRMTCVFFAAFTMACGCGYVRDRLPPWRHSKSVQKKDSSHT